MTEARRKPLLVDRFLAQSYSDDHAVSIVPYPFWETTRSNLLLAKRFVFDRQATEYCAELLHREPRIIADAQDFAIPPFDRTYIEIDFLSWYRTLTGREPDFTGDTRTGYLIVNNEVRCISESIDGIGISPLAYHLNRPFSHQEEIDLCAELKISRISLDSFYWAESIKRFCDVTCEDGKHIVTAGNDEWQQEGIRSLRANHSFKIHLTEKLRTQQVWENFYSGSAGDLRNIIGLLLFLNRTSQTRYERELPHQPGRWIGRKHATFLKHRVISFSVNPVPRLIKLAAGEGIRRRLHDVRGHLCHNQVARTNHHDHDWVESESNHLKWFCECGGLRWWRKQHMRGHEEKGLVTSEYKVTE
jgi:hypothetical protein